MHLEILDNKRNLVLKKCSEIEIDAILVGGTALALQINHRKSFDFDFAMNRLIRRGLLSKVNSVFKDFSARVLVDRPSELTVLLDEEVKLTYFHYPFPNLHPLIKTEYADLCSLQDLASTKVQTIGRRGEWKDYVDIYFLLDAEKLDIKTVIDEARLRFGGEFSEKLFWEQIVYWDDLTDFSIEYVGEHPSDDQIKDYFKNLAISHLK